MEKNPFNPSGFAVGAHFTDRKEEIKWLVNGARQNSKLLLYGKRRMGKSSCILRAGEILRNEHKGEVLYVDLSRYSNLIDAGNALLTAASPTLNRWGSKWLLLLGELLKSVSLKSGVFSLDLAAKSKDKPDQQQVFLNVLDSLNKVAEKRKTPLVVAIDEFQDIIRLGSDRADWALRSAIQGHQSLGYYFAGSEDRIIQQMIGSDGAFFELLDTFAIGPISSGELASWINAQFSARHVKAKGVGEACAELGGERTRDVVDLARRTFDLAAYDRVATRKTVEDALDGLLQDKEDPFFRIWSSLPAAQQTVLQAIAAGHGSEIGATPVRREFGIRSTGEASTAAAALVEKGHLNRLGRGSFQFDSPFFHRWVILLGNP